MSAGAPLARSSPAAARMASWTESISTPAATLARTTGRRVAGTSDSTVGSNAGSRTTAR